MSCNGCRVLRKGCSETCVLRQCLRLIENPDAQGHATLFVAKFFGRAGLMSFISAVPESQRPALFQSLLFEACGRTINPVNGAVGLLWTGNWHLCQAAVETVLRGGALRPLSLDAEPEADAAYEAGPGLYAPPARRFSSSSSQQQQSPVTKRRRASPATLDDVEGAAAGTSRLEPSDLDLCLTSAGRTDRRRLKRPGTPSEESVTTSCAESGVRTSTAAACHLQEPQQQPMLLNLFA